MIQPLLRGRLLYVVLGLFVLGLYWRTIQLGPVEPPDTTHIAQSVPQHAQMAWPTTLTEQTLKDLISANPPLGGALCVLTIFIVGMSVGGIGFAMWGVWTGSVRSIWRFRSPRLPPWTFGELARITLLVILLASLLPFVRLAFLAYRPAWMLDAHVWTVISVLVLDGLVFLIILVFAIQKGRTAWSALGFSGRRLRGAIETGFCGYVAVFPWLVGLLILIMVLAQRFGFEPPMEPIQELILQETRPFILGLTVFLACLVGPIAEEVFFRGVVYTAIRRRLSRWPAIILSGAIFSGLHTNVIGFLPIMVLGGLLAYLYERTGSLVSPLAVHVLHNTFLMVLALVFRYLTPV